MRLTHVVPAVVLALGSSVQGGLLAYGICQTGCNAVTVACYAGAGFVFGTVAAAAAPPAILACNVALGKCTAACAVVALTPTP